MNRNDPFKWRHYQPEIILLGVRGYLRYPLSYRHVEEMMTERELSVDHTTVYRWVQRYAKELEKRCRSHLKLTNNSWRVDETYIKVRGKWKYLDRAVDCAGNTSNFILSAKRDKRAAKRFFCKALKVTHISGLYRQSHRMVQQLLSELFGIEMSVGSINRLRQEACDAVTQPAIRAWDYVQAQANVNIDETSFVQGNGDGNNPTGRKGWLWVVVTPLVSYFAVFLSRSQAVAEQLLGGAFKGIVNSDRFSAYNWLEVGQRQICWAHLKRDFTQMAERAGISAELGNALLEQEQSLFEHWYRVRDGTLSRTQFITIVAPIRQQVQTLLRQAAEYDINEQEKMPLAKTVRTCRQLLKVEPALWTFVTAEGIEPTNNTAERALRPAVLWRKNSFGSQSLAGSLFVARMLTVVTSLRAQNRPVLDYLIHACLAARQGKPAPSLLPADSSTP